MGIQMKRDLKILILLLIFKSHIAIGQVDSLSMLGSLADRLPQTVSEAEDDPNSRNDDKTIATTNGGKEDFTDSQYGYTGGKSFTNPPKSKFSEEELEYFGYSYFTGQPSTFAPLNNVPVPPDYLLGPDDNIKIILFGNNNANYEIKVTRDGDIFIPEIGPLFVAGITFQDLKELIRQTIASELIGTQASVTLGSLRAIDIFVLGAANKPGMYSISALSTLTNAIIKSGGIDISGSLRQIKLKRNGETVTNFDFYDLLLNGDTSSDVRLMQGDVVFIEPIGKTAAINGEINRAGIYELIDNEKLSDLINYAGGLRPKANPLTAEITRINTSSNSFDLMSVDLSIDENSTIDLRSGDVLSIYSVPNNLKKAVLVSGHSQQPGFYAWKEGMRISDLFSNSDDLLEMTDLNYLLVKRKNTISRNYEFLQVDLEDLFKNSKSKDNIFLNDQDEIILFPSILSPDLITTKLIQDKYLYDDELDAMVLEDQWTSSEYFRKSILAKKTTDDQIINPQDQYQNQDMIKQTSQESYYEYSIFEYCTISEELASLILSETEFQPRTITNVCRKQIMDPLLDLIKRNDQNETLGIISLFGNVHFPGEYPFTKEMTLSDAIKAAGGPMNGTYNAEIEITSRNSKGKSFEISNAFVNMKESKDISLQEMDIINLKQVVMELKSAEIRGEVFFPGVYPISENQTLSDLVRRAGGYTESASLEAAFFQRQALKIADSERLEKAQNDLKRKVLLSNQSTSIGQQSSEATNSLEQITALLSTDNVNEGLGRLVIDLESILSGDMEDIILEDDDSIMIPKRRQSVSVIGEVFVANSHLFQSNLSIEDYINLSGGATDFADDSNVYIIKSDGRIVSAEKVRSGFFRGRTSLINPGDTIVVPLQIQPFSSIQATTEITQIIYQMALAAAAVNSF